MPRRKRGPETVSAELLESPEPRIVNRTGRATTHGREHTIDPYAPLPGTVAVRATVASTTTEPLTRKPTATDLALRDAAREEQEARGARYTRYLDALVEFGGDQEQALAEVYRISVEEARARRRELHADVRSGMATSSVAETIERNDLHFAARASVLRRHLFSNNPAASLKAADMLAELEGGSKDEGNFESFLRLHKARTSRP